LRTGLQEWGPVLLCPEPGLVYCAYGCGAGNPDGHIAGEGDVLEPAELPGFRLDLAELFKVLDA